MVLAHPETKYDRRTASTETNYERQVPSPASLDISVVQIPEKKPADGPGSESESPRASTTTAIHHRQALHNGRPSREQFSVIPLPRFIHGGMSSVIHDVISPIQILFYPIVLWAACAMGFASNSLLALNLTQAQVFAAPPFLFTPDQIGLINFAFVVGAAIALVTAGPFSDWIALRKARKNNGVLEAEFRLPALIPYVAINLVGMVIVAIGYQRSWPWPAIVVVG